MLFSPGRALLERFPEAADGVVVMLDSGEALRAADGDLDIYWGANIGTPNEVFVSGSLRGVIGEVERLTRGTADGERLGHGDLAAAASPAATHRTNSTSSSGAGEQLHGSG